MKYLARTLVPCLVLFTVLAMAGDPGDVNGLGRLASDLTSMVIPLGPLEINVFDILFALSTAAFFYAISLKTPTDASSLNRVVLRLTGAYLLYQLVVVIPVAMFWHDIGPTEAYRFVTARLALVLIPFFYYVGLRYVRPERLVLLVNVAATALLLYGLYRYVFIGPQGGWENGEFRLRVLWGGSALLFGWLVVSGLILQPRPLYAYWMGLAGLLGIVLVNHRSGYVALVFATVSYVILSRRFTRRLVAIAVVALVGAALLAAVSPTIKQSAAYSLTTMFNPHADVTAQDRVERSALAWDYLRQHPLGDYVWNQQYYLVDLTDPFGPHNWVIYALNTQGWLSALLLFALVGSIMAAGWSVRGQKLGLAMTVYLVFYLSFCLFNGNFESLENISLFAIAAALVLHTNRERLEGPEPAPEPADVLAEHAAWADLTPELTSLPSLSPGSAEPVHQ
jgi:hypothetical protein